SVENYTRTEGIHNIFDLAHFLRILGSQKIQCTLRFEEETISFIFQTTRKTVEYIKIINGRETNSSIDFNFDLKAIQPNSRESPFWSIRQFWKANTYRGTLRGQWNLFKLFTAIGYEIMRNNSVRHIK
ncbi:MAG: hypothetical protein JSV76_04905, partial [Candidatus Bathyarchaeota archaeon]